jgi:RHS repeat-associated protein
LLTGFVALLGTTYLYIRRKWGREWFLELTYDSLDRVASQGDVWGKTLTFGYDKADNRVLVQDSEGGLTTSVYDANNRLTSRQFSGSGTQLREDFTYTLRDQMATATRYSDLAGTVKVSSTSHTYDASMRLTNIQHREASGSVLANYTYTHDVADRLTSETRNGSVTATYAYDLTDQLTQDSGTAHAYDLAGNRTDIGYVTGPKNQYLSDGVYNFFYDNEGNLTKKRRIADDRTFTFGYDHNNQLTHVEERLTDGGTLVQTVDFRYDVFGNRIEKSAGSSVQRFSYDGWDVWADLDGSSSLTTRRVYGDGVDQPVARISSGVVAWYLTDWQGSIREIADNTSGAFVYEVRFNGFGQIVAEVSASNGDRLKWQGREIEIEFSQYYFRARYYDPATGRFTGEDPIASEPNLYRAMGNGPTNARDPSGQYLLAANKEAADLWVEELQKRWGVQANAQPLSSGRFAVQVPLAERGRLLSLLGDPRYNSDWRRNAFLALTTGLVNVEAYANDRLSILFTEETEALLGLPRSGKAAAPVTPTEIAEIAGISASPSYLPQALASRIAGIEEQLRMLLRATSGMIPLLGGRGFFWNPMALEQERRRLINEQLAELEKAKMALSWALAHPELIPQPATSANEPLMRALGAAGGLIEMGVGWGIAVGAGWTGIGGVIGGAMVVHGFDTYAHEFLSQASGRDLRTVTSQGFGRLLGSPTGGEVAHLLIGLGLGFGSLPLQTGRSVSTAERLDRLVAHVRETTVVRPGRLEALSQWGIIPSRIAPSTANVPLRSSASTAGGGAIYTPRQNIPTGEVTMQELLADVSRVPGTPGAYLNVQPGEVILFEDLSRLTMMHSGQEFMLTREVVRQGNRVTRRWRIYSGTPDQIPPPRFFEPNAPGGGTRVERIVGHTHPRPIPYDPIFTQPSDADLFYLTQITGEWRQVYGPSSEPFGRIIWGLNPGETTLYGINSTPGNAVLPRWLRRP